MPEAKVSLYWNSYRYFPYEKELARLEVQSLLNSDEIINTNRGLQAIGDFSEGALEQLVYSGWYQINGITQPTLQNRLESSCAITGSQRRQSTRYSVHGMHEYRGKFNPQVVRGILNILRVPPGSKVIDPFCGSGTSLVECAHVNLRGVGCDINPLAIFIANAKLEALATEADALEQQFDTLVTSVERLTEPLGMGATEMTERLAYLSRWFNPDVLTTIEGLRLFIQGLVEGNAAIFLTLVSDLLRDYSLQEPSDLRIRRRYTPLPERPLWDAFKEKTRSFLANLRATQEIIGVRDIRVWAQLCDSRQLTIDCNAVNELAPFDAAITSPPYATALPYIDTQRLSLVWLGLIPPATIADLEAELTGSREFVGDQRETWQQTLKENAKNLPTQVFELCCRLQNAISVNDGFRRQAVPPLMYRYFSNMKEVFTRVLEVTKSNAPFALIVGHNRTTLGGQVFDIDTPLLLVSIAQTSGWIHEASIPLQTYQRYGSHAANSVRAETLVIMRRA